MIAWVVTIRPGTHDRFTDSVWLSEIHADERVLDIANEFNRRGKGCEAGKIVSDGWGVWKSSIHIQDGFISEEKKK